MAPAPNLVPSSRASAMAALGMLLSYDFWRMAVLWTLALICSHFHLLLTACFPCILHWHHRSRFYPRCRFSSAPDSIIKRPVCVVTGASSGLGAAAARALAFQGYHVILVGRCLQLLQKTIGEIKQQDNDASLSVFELLINNAGILATSCRVTSDGYDQMMQTNFIGAFVLTNLLLPLLKFSPVPSKIVNVTSFTHRCISNTDLNEGTLGAKIFDCLPTSGSYPSARTYELSKFCLLLFSYELHRQLHLVDPSLNISVIAADPGVVETQIMREIPPIISELAFKALRIMRLLQSPESGVNSIIDAALAPSDASGEYFFGGRGRTVRSSKLSYNAQLGKNLWSRSMMLFEEVQRSFD
ncbi:Short-chain dehydrogenase/reductase SDR protein [Dioscorea alata]|uniref:Short-chain dehydrogenase/reductase SDR protein n=1 Tax=Dioscorea alata TaxID=55571 RepID=A0ACB7TQU7_DIOAL|nr:Short-chain dehydrogenase/reductase SDR protein [Dioscorea alata]